MQVFYFVIDLLRYLRACLHGRGGPQVGEVTDLGGVTRLSIQSVIRSPHLSCKRDQFKTRDYRSGLTHLSGLPHLTGQRVPLHKVNRPSVSKLPPGAKLTL